MIMHNDLYNESLTYTSHAIRFRGFYFLSIRNRSKNEEWRKIKIDP